MKALLYKEFKLAMHPMCYVFIFVFPLMILIPSYPLAVGFIYVLAAYPILFLGANKGQQSNDLLYSVLLPVRKKDIVLARIFTVVIMQAVTILLMSALYFPSLFIHQEILKSIEEAKALGKPVKDLVDVGFGLQSYVLVLGISIIGFGLADLVYFLIYYKKGKSIVMSTLFTIIGFVVYILLFTIVLPFIKGLEFLNHLHIGIQFICLFVGILISFGLHYLTYKGASKRLEKVDF